MKLTILTEISIDIPIFPDDVINSDTIGDYVSELNCCLGNDALMYLSNKLPEAEEITILSTRPSDDGLEEYENLVNNWESEYTRKNHESTNIEKNLGTSVGL
jgi:hypothetical protein